MSFLARGGRTDLHRRGGTIVDGWAVGGVVLTCRRRSPSILDRVLRRIAAVRIPNDGQKRVRTLARMQTWYQLWWTIGDSIALAKIALRLTLGLVSRDSLIALHMLSLSAVIPCLRICPTSVWAFVSVSLICHSSFLTCTPSACKKHRKPLFGVQCRLRTFKRGSVRGKTFVRLCHIFIYVLSLAPIPAERVRCPATFVARAVAPPPRCGIEPFILCRMNVPP